MIDVDNFRVSPGSTVRDAISAIDRGGQQIALVLDADSRMVGIVTDGDVRRGLLRGVNLDASVELVMNAAPTTATVGESAEVIAERMAGLGIRHMPLVDAEGIVVGIETGAEFGHVRSVTTPVVLMAGGRGQRLYPLTKDVPKPMLAIGDTPLLEIILRNLAAQGFHDVRIAVNYLADVIVDYVGDGSQFGLHVSYLREERPLGTAGAIGQLRGTMAEPFIVMNSDLLTHVDLRRLLAFHTKQRAQATVGVREHVVEIPFGVVSLQGTRVVSMEEKPLHRSLVNAGIYVLDAMALTLLHEGEYCDMPTLLGLLMEAGHNLSAFPIHEQWLDVGRPEDLDQARSDSERWGSS